MPKRGFYQRVGKRLQTIRNQAEGLVELVESELEQTDPLRISINEILGHTQDAISSTESRANPPPVRLMGKSSLFTDKKPGDIL